MRGEALVQVAAPAKLNLALLVGPVRPDGFHEVASLMLPVSLADLVTVEKTPGAGLDVVCDVAPGADNLAAKMVRELEQRLDRTFEVRVTVEKRVPAGGGLGGGSSDAAATLVALERLYGLELSTRVRYEAAAAVGSDVPFFLWPGPQLAMGRGQVLKDTELPALHLVVAVPDLGLSTAAVYRWRDEDAEVTLKEFAPRARLLSSSLEGATTAKDVAALVTNDLEPSVVARKPQVAELIERLRGAGALAAAMTGSGAACFGIYASGAAALRARGAVAPARAWYVTDLQPLASKTDARGPAEAKRAPIGGGGPRSGRGKPLA
jgi:4-diphosphocytidyl-2-C-methyl-D-erythritol kinase